MTPATRSAASSLRYSRCLSADSSVLQTSTRYPRANASSSTARTASVKCGFSMSETTTPSMATRRRRRLLASRLGS